MIATLSSLLAGLLAPPLAGPGEDVRYGADPELAAELLLPDAEPPFPGAVILQGSGPSDRSNPWSRAIAEELARSGLAVLLTDKRGCGASRGEWRTAGFDELADDALAGVGFLRSLPEVDPGRVGLVGLSQGGWVAPVAAARSREVAFVVDVSGAAVGFVEPGLFEMANTARQAGFSEEVVGEVLELNRLAGRHGLAGEWAPYERARARALEGPWKAIAAGFPASADDPLWTFLRKVGSFDPLPHWALVSQPALVLYGAEDERDNVPVAESVRRLEHAFALARKTNARIEVVPGANHAFIDPDRQQLSRDFVERLTTWVRATVVE